MSEIHRLLIGAALIVASLAPAGSALALSDTNHNELLLLDDRAVSAAVGPCSAGGSA